MGMKRARSGEFYTGNIQGKGPETGKSMECLRNQKGPVRLLLGEWLDHTGPADYGKFKF